jgi:hypothetical protein
MAPLTEAFQRVEQFLISINAKGKDFIASMRSAFERGGWTEVGKQLGVDFVDAISAAVAAGNWTDAILKPISNAFDQIATGFVTALENKLSQLDWKKVLKGVAGQTTIGPPAPPEMAAPPGFEEGGTQGQGNWLYRFRQWLFGNVPRYQEGGVVPGLLHPGEMVLPPDISRGLQSVIKTGAASEAGTGIGDFGGVGRILDDIWQGLRSWWTGSGAYRPLVRIDNVDEVAEGIAHEVKDALEGLEDQRLKQALPEINPDGTPHGRMAIGAPRRSGAGAGPLVGRLAQRAREMGAYLQQQLHLDQAHTIAALANAYAESGFDPRSVNASGHFGLFQWDKTRQQAMRNYLAGTDVNDWRNQLGFFIYEIATKYPQFLAMNGSAEQLTAWLEHNFERPGLENETGRASYASRVRAALGATSAMNSAQPFGTTNTYHAGDRSVTVNAQNNFHVTGMDAYEAGGAINSVISRQNADLVRNLSAAVM